MALSKTDKRRCCDTCRPYRSVKLDFSHLLSGGPNSQAEASEHARSSITEGYGLDINSVIEYNNRFGLECAPFSEFKGTYATNHDFNCMSLMYYAEGTSNKSLIGRAETLSRKLHRRYIGFAQKKATVQKLRAEIAALAVS